MKAPMNICPMDRPAGERRPEHDARRDEDAERARSSMAPDARDFRNRVLIIGARAMRLRMVTDAAMTPRRSRGWFRK
jgi:hypothetical protein